ncbi:AAA family ATPase [Polynucleobacter sp. MWH-Spelu-300-X4]|uniref:ATP-binding protein n=1 Tax=Polynucleobacter sp. MWH-Spelu-300-X4 TaxID=2689109 RepID=UPI001BFEC71C|nr:ATP-binding protein [Polynucleobacter sp. MWH-Spelu-300-X4]QWD79244.1 AAA family ATPase [Polynucleobacter sp. MWH-Spelu-300-X4]
MIIFLGGIHGVGKSFLGAYVAEENYLLYKSASQLIKGEMGKQSWSEKKITGEIEANQEALISAISRLKKNQANLLLDGHFCLMGSDGAIKIIEIDVFKKLGLDAILLLESDSGIIKERLKNRDDVSYTDTFLNEFLLKERHQAILVSEKLNIPLKVLHNPDKEQFNNEIKSILKENI